MIGHFLHVLQGLAGQLPIGFRAAERMHAIAYEARAYATVREVRMMILADEVRRQRIEAEGRAQAVSEVRQQVIDAEARALAIASE